MSARDFTSEEDTSCGPDCCHALGPCTCARDGSARNCVHHTQEDFDAADAARDVTEPPTLADVITAEQRDEWRALAEAATPANVGRVRKIGHGQKRHPETVALFDQIADALPSLPALLEALDAAEGRARHLALSRADEHTRAHKAAGEALQQWIEVQRLRDGITALAEDDPTFGDLSGELAAALRGMTASGGGPPGLVMVERCYATGLGKAAAEVIQSHLHALLNPTERTTP